MSLPSISSAVRPSNDIDKSASAATAEDELEAALDATQYLSTASDSALKTISGFSSKNELKQADTEKENDTTAATKEIKDLAEKVANQIGSAYQDETESAKLIEISTKGLDPEKVKQLLS